MSRPIRVRDYRAVWILGCLMLLMAPRGYAVVGQAEKYDEFTQEQLDEFHENLLKEENGQFSKGEDVVSKLTAKRLELKNTKGPEAESIEKEIDELKKQLLSVPKRDKFRAEFDGSYNYDTNVARNSLRKEKDDSQMDFKNGAIFDLSGKKTQLQFETTTGKHWSVEFPEGDSWTADGRLRFRRKHFKKILHSTQSLLSRNSSKTIEINQPKIRWDAEQTSSFNFPMTPKFSTNLETNGSKRLFTQEAFDQDSSWQSSFAPSMFWNVTPKSRFSAGYNFGTGHIRTKTGDTNSHEIHIGYFGKVKRKSSTSLDLSVGHQTPKSRDTAAVNTVSTGIGYIWQLTPKTQMTIQLIRSLQNTTSDLVSGSLDGENATVKTDSYFSNNSFSVSLNSRLNSKLTAILNLNLSHLRSHTTKDGEKDSESQQIGFPFSITFNYVFKRWVRLTTGYTFSYRIGDEKTDYVRDHLWASSVNISV